MTVNTDALVSMSEANRNFSKVVRVVDEKGSVILLKNNKPRYVIVSFEEYEEIRWAMADRRRMIDDAAGSLIDENLDALQELAK